MDRALAESKATQIVSGLGAFFPDCVVYIERGGRPLGVALSERLGVPAHGIDIGYPISRLPHPAFRALAFPVKELCYRLTRPRLGSMPLFLTDARVPKKKILLVDDSASSGKTLEVALDLLASAGVSLTDVRVAAGRVGKRARELVHIL